MVTATPMGSFLVWYCAAMHMFSFTVFGGQIFLVLV
jgi:hypothetical protein